MTNSGWPNSTAWPFWLWPQLRCLTLAALTLACTETGKVLANDLLMASPDDEQRLAELDSLAVFNKDGLDDTALIGLDLVEQFHRLDDA